MEDDAVVEPALHQRLDLRDVLGRPVGPQRMTTLPFLVRQDDGVVGVLGRREGGGSGEKRKRQRGAAAEKEHAGPRDGAAGSPRGGVIAG